MIKIDNVIKGEGYYTLMLMDGMETYGVIFTMVPDRPVTVEFLEYDKENPGNIICLIPEKYPERYQEVREKYLDILLEYFKTLE